MEVTRTNQEQQQQQQQHYKNVNEMTNEIGSQQKH